MLDGKKLTTLQPADALDQNAYYNGWTVDINRNLVLIWDPYGKIICTAVNTPWSFHDFKSTLWCDMYNHILKIPDGYKIVRDSAFATGGKLKGNILKLEDECVEYNENTDYKK